MHTLSHSKTVKVLPCPLSEKTLRKASASWKPQAPNLTPDEIRKIVIDLIG
jgi:hypothetical protein